jgi:shikimate dehydrogenase
MDDLGSLRTQIDKIDQMIMQLLDQRFDLTNQVGNVKSQIKKEILDTNREKIIYEKVSKYSHFPQISTIYKTIMEESKKSQRK